MNSGRLKSLTFLTLIMLLTLILSGCGGSVPKDNATTAPPQKGESYTIRVGTIKSLSVSPLFVAKALDLYKQQGLTVDIREFDDGPGLMEALSANKFDVAFLGSAPAITWNSKGLPIKIVSSLSTGGHAVMVREESSITSYRDLKGKKIALPKAGSINDPLFLGFISKEVTKISPEEFQVVRGLGPGELPVALMVTKQADVISTWEPFIAKALLEYKQARVLIDIPREWEKVYGTWYPGGVIAATDSIIQEHPEELRKFLAVQKQAIDFINQEPAKANTIISRELKLDLPVIERARERVRFTWQLNARDLLRMAEYIQSLGYIKQAPGEADLVNTEFLPKN